jgi:uracil-DNA glycosylase family 4
VLGLDNGPVPCPIMFVGEAPGRLGAGRTGVPFQGDVAGSRFEALLSEAGLCREGVFITNAVLCLPADACGRNRRPLASEVRNCAGWLSRALDVVRPQVVVALGGVALDGLRRTEPHGLRLAADCGRPVAWRGATLVALYHPGARAAAHRPWASQVGDWRRLGALVSARKRDRSSQSRL